MSNWTPERDAALVSMLAYVEDEMVSHGRSPNEDPTFRDLHALRAAWLAERAEVSRLRALLAEPSEEEAERLEAVYQSAVRLEWESVHYGPRQPWGVRAILADLRGQAGLPGGSP